jgi:hypothetical protein
MFLLDEAPYYAYGRIYKEEWPPMRLSLPLNQLKKHHVVVLFSTFVVLYYKFTFLVSRQKEDKHRDRG